MSRILRRNILISLFVIVWVVVFHYESTRHMLLQPHFSRPLPKVKFLYPPAGWIMFFHVDDVFQTAEVFGLKNGDWTPIDPHEILLTRFIGFDNIHRNVLLDVLDRRRKPLFCRFLARKFPYFDDFLVTVVDYPSLTKNRWLRRRYPIYQCFNQP